MQPLFSSKPLVCREMVGREHELQVLLEVLRQAATGQPQCVLLAGEAGVGKTKLCRVFMEESQAEQGRVLFGQAIPQDVALPYGLFLDAFRRYFATLSRSQPPPRQFLYTSLTFLLQLFPELAPMLHEHTPSPLESKSKAVLSKQAVSHGFLHALQELAYVGQGPLLFVLEDLHWADESSLELLAFLAHRLDVNRAALPAMQTGRPNAFMLLATYRTEALADNPLLSRLLLQLHAQRQAHDLHLHPLNVTEHRRCVSSILGQPIAEEFANFLFHWDEGNPFFTEELLGSMAVSGQLRWHEQGWQDAADMRPHLPSSLTTAILERFERLPSADQEVLRYAAVIGRVFDVPLLTALCGLDERELVDVLRRAMNAQLISEASTTEPVKLAAGEQVRYQFRHVLTREAIYEQMLAPERRMRHRRVAELIEQALKQRAAGNIPASLSEFDTSTRLLVEHYWLAGFAKKAFPYAVEEAGRARRIFAFREERHYLRIAQASLPEEDPERLQFLHRMGMLSLAIHDFADALHWLERAKQGYQRIGQQRQVLQIMANLLFVNWFLASQSMPDLVAEVEAAAEVVFADPDPTHKDVETLVAATLLAHYWTVHCQYSRSARWIERCFVLFESLDDPRKVLAIQLTYITRAWFKAHRHREDFEEGIAEIRQAVDLASRYSLPDVLVMGYATFGWLLIAWGRSEEAQHVLQEAMGLEERTGTLLPAFLLGWLHFFSGEQWELGISQLRLHIERFDQLKAPYIAAIARVALAHLLLAQNDVAEAQTQLQIARAALERNDEYIYSVALWWGLAKLHRVQGDFNQARHWYEYGLRRWKMTDDTFLIAPLLLDGILSYVDTSRLTEAHQWIAELEAMMQVTDNPVSAAVLLQAQGVLAAAEGRLEHAIPMLRGAVEAWGTLKCRYLQAQAAERLAQVLLAFARKAPTRSAAQEAREEANGLLSLALAAYQDIQAPTRIEAIHTLRTRTRLEAQQKRRSTLEGRHLMQGLTERESQVLLQLAAGLSNREIASQLHISVGTVEQHVSRILSKLGCETRTQAAAYAVAHSWVKYEPTI